MKPMNKIASISFSEDFNILCVFSNGEQVKKTKSYLIRVYHTNTIFAQTLLT